MNTISGRRVGGFLALAAAIVVVTLGIATLLDGQAVAPSGPSAAPPSAAPSSPLASATAPGATPSPVTQPEGTEPTATIEIPPPIR